MIESFGTLPDSGRVHRILLSNGRMRANILTYGATLQALYMAPHIHSLVLGFREFSAYLENPYFGAMVGRVANRLDRGILTLNGKKYDLDRNEHGRQMLHGGRQGIAFRNWEITDYRENHVSLAIEDTPHHGGFPGDCRISVSYMLEQDSLVINTTATSNEPTVCNIAHHSYFNLGFRKDILDHSLRIAANEYLPTNAHKIPTGEIAPVADSPFDFRKSAMIRPASARLIDHNYCLVSGASPACELYCPNSEIGMMIETSQPGLQVFMANRMKSTQPGHNGEKYGSHSGIALEPQHWPDAPNHAEFPDISLRLNETYHQKSMFRFFSFEETK